MPDIRLLRVTFRNIHISQQRLRLPVAFVSLDSSINLSYCNMNRLANYDVRAANRFGPDLLKLAIQFELSLVTHADLFIVN